MSASSGSVSHLESSHANLRNERLQFPPAYVGVGIYRLCTDKKLLVPMWDKCRHGLARGSVVGIVWVALTFNIQRKFVEIFLNNSPSVTGLSGETMFGYKLPFTVTTYATVIFVSSQVSNILRFFLAHGLRISRERAWDQTVLSRGKTVDFWGPYVEEYINPPIIPTVSLTGISRLLPWKWSTEDWASSWVARRILRMALLPLEVYPFVGIAIAAFMKALGTARYLHQPYFKAKKMAPSQIAVFVEERKWNYRAFGFAAAVLEAIPILGLFFSVSNRIGAAMWAHDLEKRQHEFSSGTLQPLRRATTPITPPEPGADMAGAWKDN